MSKPKYENINPIYIMLTIMAFFALILVVFIKALPVDQLPDPVVLQLETRHELYHISGQYRVIIRINGEYRGSLMMSRHELKRPHRIDTDYLIDLDIAGGM